MSVNLHLGVVVRGYHADRAAEIERAVRAILVKEEIDVDLPPLAEAEDGAGRCLVSRSDRGRPVIISGAYEWATRVEGELRQAVATANGGPCALRFEWDDADEGRESDDECDIDDD
ncbi:MAG TPA: hypothetical protein VGJ05_01245 [Fimbriiglobus sp.]|jgi:hypothetical protein